MMYLLLIVCCVCVASIVFCGILLGKYHTCKIELDNLWECEFSGQQALNKFTDMHASTAEEIVRLTDRADGLEKDVTMLKEAVAELVEHNVEKDDGLEQRIAARIEKKWDDGLQSILNYNPLTGKREDETE